MEKRGVVQGEGEAPRDKRASDQKTPSAGSDAVSKAAEAAATPPKKADPK